MLSGRFHWRVFARVDLQMDALLRREIAPRDNCSTIARTKTRAKTPVERALMGYLGAALNCQTFKCAHSPVLRVAI
jgi:hypothetical protein